MTIEYLVEVSLLVKEFLRQVFSIFCLKKYVKPAIKLFVYMSNERLRVTLQLNIFIFEARAGLQTLLRSLKQNSKKSARLGNNPN